MPPQEISWLLLLVFLLVCLLAAMLLTRREKLWPAASCSLAAWVVLGVFAACVAEQPLPPEHVLSRMAAGQISGKVPLRYVGRLRNEVSRLPWGYGLELDLTRVESAAGALPLRGGMRITFTPKDGEPTLPQIHAGDEVAVLTAARLPLVYKDAGAFDRREFLAQQNIHVQATLRASTLLEKIATPPTSLETRLARWRGNLRDELDALFPGFAGRSRDSARDASWGPRVHRPGRIGGLPEDRRVPRSRRGRTARWRAGLLLVLADAAPAASAHPRDSGHLAGPFCLHCDCRAASARAARGADGRHRRAWNIFLQALGTLELRGVGRAHFARGKA